MPSLLPIEARILLQTASGAEGDAELQRLLAQPFSWDGLLVLAEWERTLPISWQRIRAVAPVPPPPEVQQSFDRLCMVCQFQSMTLEERLGQLLTAYERANIPVILLKGSALALSAYPAFADRPMGDLDLLIPPADASRAWDIALALKWNWDEQAFPRAHYQAHHHLPPLFDVSRTGAKLELHTALSLSSHPFALSFDQAMAVSRPLERAPGRAYGLDPAHTLVHLAVHFAWAHLASFGIWRLARDLAALKATGIDWNQVRELAERYRAGESVYWSVRLAEYLCGVQVAPAEVLEEFRPRRPAWLLDRLERHLAVHVISRVTPCPSEKLRRFMWALAMNPRRVSTSSARPWDAEPTAAAGPVRLADRVRQQLSHGRDWRRYFALLRSA